MVWHFSTQNPEPGTLNLKPATDRFRKKTVPETTPRLLYQEGGNIKWFACLLVAIEASSPRKDRIAHGQGSKAPGSMPSERRMIGLAL
jgi:hypothetical protein